MNLDFRRTTPGTLAQETTPTELLQWLENRDRYIAQSAATRTAERAELPPRPPLSRQLNPPK